MRRWVALGVAALVLMAASPRARAGGILIEARVEGDGGEGSFARSFVALKERLLVRGYRTSSAEVAATLGEVLGARLVEPLIDAHVEQARARIQAGYEAWLHGRFQRCIDQAGGGLEQLLAGVPTLASSVDARAEVLRANLLLALAYGRLGKQALARQALAEIVRTFPSYRVDRKTWGPEPVEPLELVRAELAAAEPGLLHIQVMAATTQIFINERLAGAGALTESLPPGQYRIFVRSRGHERGTLRLVTVRAGRTTRIYVDPVLDRVTSLSEVGLVLYFASEAERARHAARIAGALVEMARMERGIVIGVSTYQGRRALIGATISGKGGRMLGAAVLPLEPEPPAARIDALAEFLISGRPAPGIELVDDHRGEQPLGTAGGLYGDGGSGVGPESGPGAGPGPGGSGPDSGPGDSSSLWPWATLAGGVASLSLGLTYLAIDGTPSCDIEPCQELYDTRAPGLIFTGVGAALVGTSIWLWVRGSGKSRNGDRSLGRGISALQVTPRDAGWVISLAGRF